MRILTLHNRYQLAGGEDRAQRDTTRLLRERGHEVVELSEDNARIRELGPARTAVRTIWSQESYSRVRATLQARRFDALDVHNTFPLLSPAVYYAARAEAVPVVQTLHNYRLACSRATLYRDGRPCHDCVRFRSPMPALLHKCYRGSRGATAGVAAMLVVHRALRTWSRLVDVYVTMTESQRRTLVEGGLPRDRVVVKPHFVHPDPGPGAHRGQFVLYVGRLEPEKGVSTLLDAWGQQAGARYPLKIIGDGSLAQLVADAGRLRPDIQWLGHRNAEDVAEAMGEAALVVVPSEWQEPFGLVVIEAFARGAPVLASNAGGLPELVTHGRTGLIARAGDTRDLAVQLDWAQAHPRELASFGVQAREVFEQRYTADANYASLLGVFQRAIGTEARDWVAA
jgi:glycosyltransferase involved in cell wall biosynthesis